MLTSQIRNVSFSVFAAILAVAAYFRVDWGIIVKVVVAITEWRVVLVALLVAVDVIFRAAPLVAVKVVITLGVVVVVLRMILSVWAVMQVMIGATVFVQDASS